MRIWAGIPLKVEGQRANNHEVGGSVVEEVFGDNQDRSSSGLLTVACRVEVGEPDLTARGLRHGIIVRRAGRP